MKKLLLSVSILLISTGLSAAEHEKVFFGQGQFHANYIKGRNLNSKTVHAEYNKKDGTYKAFVFNQASGWTTKEGHAAKAIFYQLKKEYLANQLKKEYLANQQQRPN